MTAPVNLTATTKKVRSSNFELLRILAMFLIINFHLTLYGVIHPITQGSTEYFNHPAVYLKLFILYTVRPWGKIGVALFVIISGYFMVKKGSSVNLFSTAKKLFLHLAFASIFLVFGSTFYINLFRIA